MRQKEVQKKTAFPHERSLFLFYVVDSAIFHTWYTLEITSVKTVMVCCQLSAMFWVEGVSALHGKDLFYQ